MKVIDKNRTQRSFTRGMAFGSPKHDSEPCTGSITKLSLLEEPSSECPFNFLRIVFRDTYRQWILSIFCETSIIRMVHRILHKHFIRNQVHMAPKCIILAPSNTRILKFPMSHGIGVGRSSCFFEDQSKGYYLSLFIFELNVKMGT